MLYRRDTRHSVCDVERSHFLRLHFIRGINILKTHQNGQPKKRSFLCMLDGVCRYGTPFECFGA